MSQGGGKSRNTGGARAGGGRSKTGKPRPGTGGKGRRALEGKGPTPPAEMRPGHPAQRRAAAAARSGAAGKPGAAGAGRAGGASTTGRTGGASTTSRPGAAGNTGSGRPGGTDGRVAYEPQRIGGRGDEYGAGRAGARPDTSGRGRSRTDLATRGIGDAPEYVAGRNAVVESLAAGVPAMALYVGPRTQQDERVSDAIKLASAAGIAVLEASPGELDRLTGGALHQGIALRVRPYEYAHPDDLISRAEAAGELPLIIALDGVTDPRNLGAIVRSAAAFGAHGVLVPTRRSAGVTAGAWKASAGAIARVPVARASNLARALTTYQESGLFVAGLDAAGKAQIRDLELATVPLVLVAGSEGRGLSRIVSQGCDLLVRIPIAAETESLNAGVAASIALYEVAAIRAGAS